MEPETIYYMCAVRLPRWSSDLLERLAGADIDPFRLPDSYGDEAVEIPLELHAASEADARVRIRSALSPAGVRLMPWDIGPCGATCNAPPDRFRRDRPCRTDAIGLRPSPSRPTDKP